jgi:hypothetical protein
MTAIPFVRQYPSGRLGFQEVERPQSIEAKAMAFLNAGGTYFSFLTPEGKAQITAVIGDSGKPVAQELSENGPELLEAIDRLIEESAKHTPIAPVEIQRPALRLIKSPAFGHLV